MLIRDLICYILNNIIVWEVRNFGKMKIRYLIMDYVVDNVLILDWKVLKFVISWLY